MPFLTKTIKSYCNPKNIYGNAGDEIIVKPTSSDHVLIAFHVADKDRKNGFSVNTKFVSNKQVPNIEETQESKQSFNKNQRGKSAKPVVNKQALF